MLFVQDDMAARLRSVLSLAGIPQEGFPVKVGFVLCRFVRVIRLVWFGLVCFCFVLFCFVSFRFV